MEATRRLAERYIKEHPGVDWQKASAIVADRHEEVGAMMDAMEGHKSARMTSEGD